MRRTRIIGLCLAGVCALSAFAAAGASAAPPEIGRCFKVATPKTGAYGSKGCVKLQASHKGEYEWAAGAASPAIEITLTGPHLEGTSGRKLTCTVAFLVGEIVGAKEVKITKETLDGCIDSGHNFDCYSNIKANNVIEVETALKGELGDIPGSAGATPWVGVDLKPESGSTIVEFLCGEGTSMEKHVLSGSVIGRLKPTDKMSSPISMIYKQSGGKQIPEAFIGGSPDVLSQEISPFPFTEKTIEQTGLATTFGELKAAEPLEVKAK